MQLVYGLITGILFGMLLQRAEVLRFERQVGALRLVDMTIVKFMLSAICVGMVLLYTCVDLGLAELSVKGLSLGGQIVGGLIFGLGWGVLGYCPGTAYGALGEGRFDALWGILGGFAGAALYAEVYPSVKETILTWGDFGKVTIPSALGINHWIVIVLFLALCLGLFRFFESRHL